VSLVALKEPVGLDLFPFFFSIARCDPSLPPWIRLHWRWAIPDPSRPGVRSPVMANGGSWSALAPCGLVLGSVISTGEPHLMHVGSQLASTNLTQFL
jgi:hypothetical protein